MTTNQPTAIRPTTRPKGHELTPNWDEQSESVFDGRFFWIGVLPKLTGMSSLAVGGLSFPLIEEIIGRTADGRTTRDPKPGAIVFLDKAKIEFLRECFSRLVIRWHTHNGIDREGNPTTRRAQIIKIPKPADVAAMKKNGKTLSPYFRRKGDEPAARYMFAVPCKNQIEGSRDGDYPDSLEITDLKWPQKAAPPKE